jgi:hypothetical protein
MVPVISVPALLAVVSFWLHQQLRIMLVLVRHSLQAFVLAINKNVTRPRVVLIVILLRLVLYVPTRPLRTYIVRLREMDLRF